MSYFVLSKASIAYLNSQRSLKWKTMSVYAIVSTIIFFALCLSAYGNEARTSFSGLLNIQSTKYVCVVSNIDLSFAIYARSVPAF